MNFPRMSVPVIVTSPTFPSSTSPMKTLKLMVVSFFVIWATCQTRKRATRMVSHSMTVLNVDVLTGLLGLLRISYDSRPPFSSRGLM